MHNLADKHIKSFGLLEILTIILLSAQNQKCMELFKKCNLLRRKGPFSGWGGGGKCRFVQVSLNMQLYKKKVQKLFEKTLPMWYRNVLHIDDNMPAQPKQDHDERSSRDSNFSLK